MNNDYEFTATVTKISRNTEGWGETKRVVGVKVDAVYQLDVVGENEAIERSIELTLPLELSRVLYPGDTITVTVSS